MPQLPLVKLRFAALFVIIAVALGLILWARDTIGLELHWLGWVNLFVFLSVVAWYAFDQLFERRERALWSHLLPETAIETGLRFWRRIALLACTIAAAGSVLNVLAANDMETKALVAGKFVISDAALAPLGTLMSVFLAAFGWMYTTFEKERGDRSAATVKAVNDMVQTGAIRDMYEEVRDLTLHIRDKKGISPQKPLPIELMSTELSVLPTHQDVADHRCRTLGSILDDYFNVLDNLAYGVRRGQLELRTVDRVLRPHILRFAFVYSDYIAVCTNATNDPIAHNRRRSTSKVWEHYLWLVVELGRLDRKEKAAEQIVLPPRFI